MSERDQIYVQILHYGLISLHNHTSTGDIEYLHYRSGASTDVPSLIGEMNEARHEYYLRGHRGLYLERIDQTKESLGFVLNRYRELWPQLESIYSKYAADE